MISAPGELVIDSSDEGHVIAQFNPLLVVVFARAPQDAELETVRRLVEEGIDAAVCGGLLYVVARKDMSGGVNPRVREMFEELIRKHQDHLGRSAVVVLAEGFAGAIVRGVLAGLLSLFERRSGVRVFGSVSEACRWLAHEHRLDPAKLLQSYERATACLSEKAV